MRKHCVTELATFFALILTACAPPSRSIPTPTLPAPVPTNIRPATLFPTRPSPSAPPVWWNPAIALPKGAEFVGDAQNAVWSTHDTDVDGIKDFMLRQARAAGYQSFVIPLSQGAIYDVLLLKGQTAFALNLTLGSDVTVLTATRVGVMHIKISGMENLELDLPLRSPLDTSPGSEVSIGTAIPNPACAGCMYFVNIHIAPFKGIGNYDSKPGTYLIDPQVIPGGDPDVDDYRWAQSCVVNIPDAQSGNFDCRGLQNVNDQTKKIDVNGSWAQP